MLFAARIQADSTIEIHSTRSGTLIINNISLSQSSDSASLYLHSSQSLNENSDKILVVNLNKPSFQAYHTQVRLNLSKDKTKTLNSVGGSIHIIGYFVQDQGQEEINTINEVIQIKTIKSINDNKEKNQVRSSKRNSNTQANSYKNKDKQEKKEKDKNSRPSQNKTQDKSKSKPSSKGKSLLEMMNDLDDDDEDQQSDYQQQEQPSSSSSSSQESEQTPPVTKKQSKQIKSQKKQLQLKKNTNNMENPSYSKVASQINVLQYKLLTIFPNLLRTALNLALKIVEDKIFDLYPIPQSLQQKLKTNDQTILASLTTEQHLWFTKLNHSILSVQSEYFCKDPSQKQKCSLKKQQLEQLINQYQKTDKKSQFEYQIPTTLPSFVTKK